MWAPTIPMARLAAHHSEVTLVVPIGEVHYSMGHGEPGLEIRAE
jgi:hypothetical protein